eukprot:14402653-Ditylum_brightwellii.AAC.1
MIQCNHCGGRHHKDIQCSILINHLANISYPKKHPKTEETVLKSNPTPQRQCSFQPSCSFNRHQQNKCNDVNKIDDDNNNKDEESNIEQKQFYDENKTEDLCHINTTEYKEDSDNEEYDDSTNNININLQQTSGIGVDIEQSSPASN